MSETIRSFFEERGVWTYMIVHAFIVAYPLAQSFEHRLKYYTKWTYLWRGLLISALFMIAWDALFTAWGVWSFNPKYVLGIYYWGLPIEEWMFFITAPFACIFIYECVKYFIPNPDIWRKHSLKFTWVVIAGLSLLAMWHYDKLYTSIKVGLTALALLVHVLIFKDKYLGRFWITYLLHLIPFMLTNGVLTFMPVVMYNDNEYMGIRYKDFIGVDLFNIPIEDSIYSLLILIMNISFYEWEQSRKKQSVPVQSSVISH